MFGLMLLLAFASSELTPPALPTPPVIATPPVVATPPVASPSAGPVVPNAPAPPGNWVYQRKLTPAEEERSLIFLGVVFALVVAACSFDSVWSWHMRRFRPAAWNRRMDKEIAGHRSAIEKLEIEKV
jgi:hypothetical protein